MSELRHTSLSAPGLEQALAANRRATLDNLVSVARDILGMDFVYLAALDDARQVHVATAGDAASFGAPNSTPSGETICRLMVDGRVPTVIPDVAAVPEVSDLPVVAAAQIGAYVGVPVTLGDGRVFGTLCGLSHGADPSLASRDLTFLRVLARLAADHIELAEERARGEETARQTLARIAHDLRSPLTAIVGYASLLAAATTKPEYAETIIGEAQRLGEMVTELLDGGAAVTGKAEAFDLLEIARSQARVFRGQSTHHISIVGATTIVFGDVGQTTAAVANLLSNAIKYSPAGGRVEVGVHAGRTQGTLSVRDDGVGIPESAHEALFTPFFRVRSDDTRGIPGTGLGLALVREALRRQDGDAGFTSRAGAGSTFWITLPLAACAAR